MAYKDILVHLDGGTGEDTRLRLAVALARRHDTQLIGFYGIELIPLTTMATPAAGSYAEMETMRLAVTQQRDVAMAMAAEVEERFQTVLQGSGIAGEFRLLEGVLSDLAVIHARYADLTVVGQADPDNPPTGTLGDLPEYVLTGSGRPVLIVPYAGKFETMGQHVLVAWNATREAARAVGDAMPILQQAKKVTVLSIDAEGGISGDGDQPATDMADRLKRHGIAAEASALTSNGDVTVGDLVLSRAADFGCDLIVMGGYGHSPTRELLLGGATRELMQHMTVPVLMSH